MPKERLGEVLQSHREQIACAWAQRTQQSSDHYRTLPAEDVQWAAREVVDGLVEAVVSGDFLAMSEVLQRVAERRLALGFEAAEVQRALLMGCDAIYPALEEAFGADAQNLVWSVSQIEKAMYRGLGLLNEAFHAARVKESEARLAGAVEDSAAAQDRLRAVLQEFAHGAVVFGPDRIVRWSYGQSDFEGANLDDALGGLIAEAFATGKTQHAAQDEASGIRAAIPVVGEGGQVVEVVAIL